MSFLSGKRILVTGAAGFLGAPLCQVLRRYDPAEIIGARSRDYDLREREEVRELFAHAKPDVVIHLAAVVGGIAANRDNPGRYFYENAVMGLEAIEAARLFGVEKFVSIGTVCSYPKFAPVPFIETDLWDGYPEETNAPYGLAKKMLLIQSQGYRKQYGLNAIHLLLSNLFGPRDSFDLQTSHVIPALIRKVIEARDEGRDSIEVWGTGTATREFLFVRDAAEGIALAAEHYNRGEPVNIGSGQEISICVLASLICELAGFEGQIIWDTLKPDGQPRRCVCTARAWREFGFAATTGLREGLAETIEWYEQEHSQPRKAEPATV